MSQLPLQSLAGFPTSIRTHRLLLRHWVTSDLEPFAEMNADPRVMEFFPACLSRTESDASAARIQKHFEEKGFGLWAVEIPGVTEFAGFIGLSTPRYETHFTPCIEIGWRLASAYWGCGYATEGALATLEFASQIPGLAEIVSMTTVANYRSRRVMEKIGMNYDAIDDFDHPFVPKGHTLSRHVLYRFRFEHPRAQIEKESK